MGDGFCLDGALSVRERLKRDLKRVEEDILESQGYMYTMFRDWERPSDGRRISRGQAICEVIQKYEFEKNQPDCSQSSGQSEGGEV